MAEILLPPNRTSPVLARTSQAKLRRFPVTLVPMDRSKVRPVRVRGRGGGNSYYPRDDQTLLRSRPICLKKSCWPS